MLKPLGDRVILKAREEEQTTGVVVAVGQGRTLDNGQVVAVAVKEGDKVLFDKYAGNEVEYDGETYLVVHEKDLVAVVD